MLGPKVLIVDGYIGGVSLGYCGIQLFFLGKNVACTHKSLSLGLVLDDWVNVCELIFSRSKKQGSSK